MHPTFRYPCQAKHVYTNLYNSCGCLQQRELLQRVVCCRRKHQIPTKPARPKQDITWRVPDGHQTGIKIYNSVTRRKEELITPLGKPLSWYTCGPTVYDQSHIGHACTFMRLDLIRRILQNIYHIDLILVMGVTDIDDKIITRAREMNMEYKQLARAYECEFFRDMGRLKILAPTVKTRVSEFVPQIMEFVQRIIDNGYAYPVDSGSVYFDLSKYEDQYGILCPHWRREFGAETLKEREAGKRRPEDFALWKSSKPGEPWWPSPWAHNGKGRPGWHIECSTMATEVLGESIDIHSGGVDLIFPHHENEIAQCHVCLSTDQWVNYWLHTGSLHLKSDGEKMSKSLKNVILVSDFLKKYTPSQLRMFCLLRNYKNIIEYSDDAMSNAVSVHKKFSHFLHNAEQYVHGIGTDVGTVQESRTMSLLASVKQNVDEALRDDFDTPRAIAEIDKLVAFGNSQLLSSTGNVTVKAARSPAVMASVYSYIEHFLGLLGVNFAGRRELSEEPTTQQLQEVMDIATEFRNQVRLYALLQGAESKHASRRLPPVKVPAESKTDAPEVLPKSSLPHTGEELPRKLKGQSQLEWSTPLIMPKADKELKASPSTKKEREPLLKACDKFRDDLILTGIQIQDQGKHSSWKILDGDTVTGRKTSYSDYDVHEAYGPK